MAERSSGNTPTTQLNIRLGNDARERLEAWAYLAGEYSHVGAFAVEKLTELINAEAERDPRIDELVNLRQAKD